MDELPKPPYPADTNAKGWRLEFDHQGWERTEAWLLLKEDERPFLLMLVLQSWRQVPCASLPNKSALLARLAGLSDRRWDELSKNVLADWFLAADQRLYHPLLIERVQAMSKAREGGLTRQARFRERDAATRPSANVKKRRLTEEEFLADLPAERAQDLRDELNGAIAARQTIVSKVAWLCEVNARWDEAGRAMLYFGESERARRRAHIPPLEPTFVNTQPDAVDTRGACANMREMLNSRR